jgi:hypothetical protein
MKKNIYWILAVSSLFITVAKAGDQIYPAQNLISCRVSQAGEVSCNYDNTYLLLFAQSLPQGI